MLRLHLALGLLALLIPTSARVSFLGYPNGGNITVTCGTQQQFPVGLYFAQTCVANNCIAPVSYSWSPDLTGYRITLNTVNPVTIVIDPTPEAIAQGTLSTMVTASDSDGPPANGTVSFKFDCPLTLLTPIPDQDAQETVFYSLNASYYFGNPARHALSWSIEGLVAGSGLSINSATGVLSGVPAMADAITPRPYSLTIVAMDTVTRAVVRSNTFQLRVTALAGISFPSSLGIILAQNATEGVLYSFNAARHFNNPSNFRVNWTVTTTCTICTGFSIDSNGLITITPGANELRFPNIQLTVVGVDERGNIATSNTFTFTVTPQRLSFLTISTLPDLMCGSFCCSWNPVDYVLNPSSNPLTFSLVSGIPGGSSIRVSSNGTLAGLASMIDVRASPITLRLSVNNGNPQGPTPMPALMFNVLPLPAPTLSSQPLPLQTIRVDVFFQLDVSPYFILPAGSPNPAWSIASSSPSLTIDFNGKVSGTIVEADYNRNPVFTFNVTVSNKSPCGGGNATQMFQFTIDPNFQGPVCGLAVLPNIAVCEKSVFPVRNFSGYCRDPKNASLTYTIRGLPNGTGLVFNPANGMLSGIVAANAGDLGVGLVSVCATNIHNLSDCTPQFQLTFRKAKRPPIADPPIPSPVTAIKGQRFVGYFNFHFYEPDWQPLIYSVAGLPVGSGLGIGPITGIFSGTPNAADFRASPLVLSVFASNEQDVDKNSVCASQGQGGRARADLIIIVEEEPSLPICNPIAVDPTPGQVGMFYARDVSKFFQPGDGFNKLEYALRSLPRGSGLSIDPRSGVVSGVLTQQDLLASPMTVVVAATNGVGMCQSTFTVNVGARGLPGPAPSPGGGSCPVNVQPIFAQNVNPSQSFTLDLSRFFVPFQNVRLTYQSSGLPRGTGFVQDSYSGLFSGVPSPADLAQGTMTILTTASCGSSGQAVSSQWQLVVNNGQCNACNGGGGCQQQCTVQDPRVCRPTCGCNYGSILNADGRTCRSGSGCDVNNGGCDQICTMQNGRPVCSCPPNWFLNSDGRTCRYDPCGTNNGGCEQLCTPNGQQARCDCRVGSLKPDLRTCSSQIIVTGTIPPGLVLGCQYFMFDFSTAFSHAGGTPLSFKMSGLPPRTGFSLSTSGLMSGTPSSADCSSAQPMTVTVTASDGVASVPAVMFLSAFCDNPSACGASSQAVISPSSASIPLLWAMVCVDFNYDLSPYFVGGQGNVQFSCLGLPMGSGFQMSSRGVLNGLPTSSDCASSPLLLTIVARDSLGRESKSVVTLKFQSCNCVQRQSTKGLVSYTPATPSFPILISPTPSLISYPISTAPVVGSDSMQLHTHATAQCGQPFFLDTAEYFRVNGLRYAVTGLPPGTGLRLSDTGVLSGTPNSVDARAVNPFMVSVTGTDRNGAYVTLAIYLEIKGDCGLLAPSSMVPQTNYRSGFATPPADSNTGILPVEVAHAGQFFRLDISRVSFSDLRGKVRYEVLGLPADSGLSMSPSGVISGTVRESACQLHPTNLTVRATQDDKHVDGILFVHLMCDDQVPAALNGGALPTATGVVGELLYFDCAPFVTATNMSSVTFQVQGLASTSNIRMSAAGVLSGIPSIVDIKGPPLLVVVRDGNGNSVQNTLRLNIMAQASADNWAPVFIPLEVVTAAIGKPFTLNIGQRFFDKNGDNMTFSITGLLNQSGLKFNKTTGVLFGSPSTFDAQQIQPVRLISFADDGRGGKTEGPIYISFTGSQTTKTTKASPTVDSGSNRDPVSLSIKRQVATEGAPFLLGVASSFVDQDGDVLAYSLEGLTDGTGLGIDRVSGLISGTPTKEDANQVQPIALTVSVTDGQGGSCAQMFLLTVFHGEATANHDPDAEDIPDAQAAVGQTFFLRLSSSFADPDGDLLTYSVSGLPTVSGLRVLSGAGILAGVPNDNDKKASPLLLTVGVSDGRGGVAKAFLNLTVVAKTKLAGPSAAPRELFTQVSDYGIPKVVFEIGVSSFFRASNFFPLAQNVSYGISGLPNGTGLSIASKTGILAGSPTLDDAVSADSLRNRLLPTSITTTDTTGRNISLPLMLQFSSPFDQINHAPFARSIPQSTASPGKKFLLDVWTSFADPDGDDLLFSVVGGLPIGTGFSIVPTSGIFFGVPSEADIAAPQPLVVTVVADDQRGGKSQENLVLSVSTRRDTVKTCQELGWRVASSATVCSRALKVDGGCPSKVPFADANRICTAAGARLCSSQELSDSRFVDGSDECDVTKQPVWTSSVCAFDNEVITQGASDDFSSSLPKECHKKTERAALVKCCANNEMPRGAAVVVANEVSEKTCDELSDFVTSPSSPNKAVCSSAAVRRGKGKAQCSGAVSYTQARQLCSQKGARVCSADELSQDVGNDQVCGYNNVRVWTSTECPFPGQVLTQAGSSAFLRNTPKSCTSMDTLLPVYCCADQRADSYFQNLEVVPSKGEINLSWNWKVYPSAQVSLRKASASKGDNATTWNTPQQTKKIRMGGDAVVRLSALQADTRYAIRITPITSDNKLVKTQAVEFRASTLV